jgi:hypothetical protein
MASHSKTQECAGSQPSLSLVGPGFDSWCCTIQNEGSPLLFLASRNPNTYTLRNPYRCYRRLRSFVLQISPPFLSVPLSVNQSTQGGRLGCALLDLIGGRRQNRTRRFGADESKAAWQAACYALNRCGKDRTGPNKMPAQGAWPTACKCHDTVTWHECRRRHFRTTDNRLVCP